MQTHTILSDLLTSRVKHPHLPAIQHARKGRWLTLKWSEYFAKIEQFAAGLAALGIKSGDRLAIAANTRCEWAIADFAILGLGAVTVPIYHSSTDEDVEFILNDSQASLLILEDKEQNDKWKRIRHNCPSIKKVISINSELALDESTVSFDSICDLGEDFLRARPQFFIKSCERVALSDLATILYTSGTTGRPKGVMLTHTQIVSEVRDSFDLFGIRTDDVTLTFLPLAHILGRIEIWGHVYTGHTLAFAESIEKISSNIKEIRPTFLIAVPRIFEKIYASILTKAEVNPLKHRLFNWALDIGQQISKCRIQRQSPSIQLMAQYRLARELVFDKILQQLGGRLKFAMCGGAPMNKEIAEFFHAIGLMILEGYGLTETTAAITVNTVFDYQFGTVGKPIGDVQIKIAEDGEILVKSQKVMSGYYNNEDATKSAFQDGYFLTGDIGELTKEGFLKITDRKKDLIKTAGGKYVAPQKIEALFKENQYISHVLVHGDRRKYIVCLFTLNPENIEKYAEAHDISYQSLAALSQDPRIKSLIRKAVADANSQLASFESIKAFAILPDEFSIATGELTPSLKIKRKYCDEKYREVIDSLYSV